MASMGQAASTQAGRVAQVLAASERGLTRAELRAATSMSDATLQRALATLRVRGWLPASPDKLGRQLNTPLRLTRVLGLLVGIVVGRTAIMTVLTDAHGRPLGEPV